MGTWRKRSSATTKGGVCSTETPIAPDSNTTSCHSFCGARSIRREYIDERVIWVYLIQILEGLSAMHAAGIIHRGGVLRSADVGATGPERVRLACSRRESGRLRTDSA
jgi:hypothetical protein